MPPVGNPDSDFVDVGDGSASTTRPRSNVSTGSMDDAVRILVEEMESTSQDKGRAASAGAAAGAAGAAAQSELANGVAEHQEQSYGEVVRGVRRAFYTGRTLSYEYRKQQLSNIVRMLEECEDDIVEALRLDLRRNKHETIFVEVDASKNEALHALAELKEWMKPEKPNKTLANMMDTLTIYKDPLGVVLVMGAWNYPVYLTLSPVIGAVAAGNAAIIKPSEIASATAEFFARKIPKYLDQECFRVVLGGVPETTELLKERFDYIFYTGSPAVGRIVRAAANKHLTPVTLELGGKSPTYLSKTADLEVAAKRILWGKVMNVGQTCVAPDYLICTPEVRDAFVEVAKRILEGFCGADPKASMDLSRIVSDRQFARLKEYLNCGRVAVGGETDASERFMAVTVLVDVKADDPVMTDEIFGPILPILTVPDIHAAIEFIKSREKPLALYVFTSDDAEAQMFIKHTSSGGLCINDVMLHVAAEGLPFGGVGESGMGSYHGQKSFDTFTHRKSALIKDLGAVGEAAGSLRYPPYTDKKMAIMRQLMRRRRLPPAPTLKSLLVFGMGVMTMWSVSYFAFPNKCPLAE